jgi:hypothetical protein
VDAWDEPGRNSALIAESSMVAIYLVPVPRSFWMIPPWPGMM